MCIADVLDVSWADTSHPNALADDKAVRVMGEDDTLVGWIRVRGEKERVCKGRCLKVLIDL